MNELPWKDPQRVHALLAALNQRILVLDGAMGTMLQGYKLVAASGSHTHMRMITVTASATSRATTICCR